MNPADRIVQSMPLDVLWDSQQELDAQRGDYLTKSQLKNLLKAGRVQFVNANPGEKLLWIDPSHCYDYWKDEVQIHFAEPNEKILLDQFPGEYVYLVSRWQSDFDNPIVLLEKLH